MTVFSRFVTASAWTLLALSATACGQASFAPTSPSGVAGRTVPNTTNGAVISGTVNGMSQRATAPSDVSTPFATTPITVTVVGTSISTTIDGSGRFNLTGVPAGDVQLKFAGTGLDATLTVRDVKAGDRIEITARITDSSIRIEAERRQPRNGRDEDDDDEDDDDDDDDDDDNDRDDDEIKGVVSGLTGTCPDIAFTLNSLNVKATTATRYEDGTCARVRNTLRLEVHGQRQTDGSILATRIELDD
jgi:hypothetical protein